MSHTVCNVVPFVCDNTFDKAVYCLWWYVAVQKVDTHKNASNWCKIKNFSDIKAEGPIKHCFNVGTNSIKNKNWLTVFRTTDNHKPSETQLKKHLLDDNGRLSKQLADSFLPKIAWIKLFFLLYHLSLDQRSNQVACSWTTRIMFYYCWYKQKYWSHGWLVLVKVASLRKSCLRISVVVKTKELYEQSHEGANLYPTLKAYYLLSNLIKKCPLLVRRPPLVPLPYIFSKVYTYLFLNIGF